MLTHGTTRLTPPSESGANVTTPLETDEFGALHVRNESIAWCDQGRYFKATNATPGTGIAMGIQTTFSDTANVLLLMRSGSATVKVIPHYVRLINTVAGASTTSSRLVVAMDTANRYTSGGTDLTTEIVGANTGAGPASVVDVLRFCAVTASAVSARRRLVSAQLKTQAAPCWVVGDEVKVVFGSDDGDQGLLSGAAAARYIVNCGPVILEGTNHCLLFHMWNPANATTAPSWEIEMGWFER